MNGALGELESLIYKINVIPRSFPIAVSVKFNNYNGSTFYNTDLVLICPVSLASYTVENCHIPLKLTWTVTIHKSQGLNIQKNFTDLGLTEKVAGLTYVSLSRVKNLSYLMVKVISF